MLERVARGAGVRASQRLPAQWRSPRARRQRRTRLRLRRGSPRGIRASTRRARAASRGDLRADARPGGGSVPQRAQAVSRSKLYVLGDRLGWSIDDDRTRLVATARRLGYGVGNNAVLCFTRGRSVFQHNHFNALSTRWLQSSHRLGVSYFHGRPGTKGYPEFDRAYEALRAHATRLERVQVTHDEMRELVVGAGVPPERVFKIPIGIDLEHFELGPVRSSSSFVVGSFVKDGVGMEA